LCQNYLILNLDGAVYFCNMEYLEGILPILYKYRSWNEPYNRRLLTDSEVYLASADQFNDPFDAALPFKYRKADLTPENIYLKLLETGRRQWDGISETVLQQRCFERQFSGDFESGAYWQNEFSSFKKMLNDSFGILSLTSNSDNLLMWSHYADSHRGFCVGLDRNIVFERCGGLIRKVDYPLDDSLPEIPLFEDSLHALSVLITTKSQHWTYENEYRIVNFKKSREVVKLPEDAILEIILGCKMPDTDKIAIHEIARKKYPHARVFETQVSKEKFRLDFLPLIQPSPLTRQ
jgi:hypothetical protein